MVFELSTQNPLKRIGGVVDEKLDHNYNIIYTIIQVYH